MSHAASSPPTLPLPSQGLTSEQIYWGNVKFGVPAYRILHRDGRFFVGNAYGQADLRAVCTAEELLEFLRGEKILYPAEPRRAAALPSTLPDLGITL